MKDTEDASIYFNDLIAKLSKMPETQILGEDLQMGTRLSKTSRGARTNARIEASQKHKGFNEAETAEDELDEVDDDVTNELLDRALENLFGE